MSDPYLYYKSIKDTPVCGHLNFNCLKLKYEVLKLGVWMSDPYLYYSPIKDTPVCGHLNLNCLQLQYEVNHDILLFILTPGYTVSTWGCVVLTVFDRHRCQTIDRYSGKFSPHLKRYLDLPERPELLERPKKYRKDQRIIGKHWIGDNWLMNIIKSKCCL